MNNDGILNIMNPLDKLKDIFLIVTYHFKMYWWDTHIAKQRILNSLHSTLLQKRLCSMYI